MNVSILYILYQCTRVPWCDVIKRVAVRGAPQISTNDKKIKKKKIDLHTCMVYKARVNRRICILCHVIQVNT